MVCYDHYYDYFTSLVTVVAIVIVIRGCLYPNTHRLYRTIQREFYLRVGNSLRYTWSRRFICEANYANIVHESTTVLKVYFSLVTSIVRWTVI